MPWNLADAARRYEAGESVAQIAQALSPHGLRHTYASLLLQAGVDVYYVSRMLGHADIGMTVGTYGAWLQPNRRPAIDALDPVASTVQANG
jgi:integrase